MGSPRAKHKLARASLTLLVALAWLAGVPFAARAQAAVQFNDVAAFVSFGEQILFQARIETSTPLQALYLLLEPQGAAPVYLPMELNERGELQYQLDPGRYSIRPFAQVTYAFRAEFESGQPVTSEHYRVDYIDTRYTWQELTEGSLTVYWYDRDIAFGQSALNNAVAGIKSVRSLLSAKLSDPIRIFIYGSPSDLQGGMKGTPSWVAGHAAPDLGVVLISIPAGPDEGLEMQRQIPHELMHLAQYEVIGENFTNQPYWLIEGMASEAELYPNPEYGRALEKAVETRKLLPLADLCAGFPRDASGAFLSYAQSASFMRYLYEQYGASGLQDLTLKYKDGLSCDKGVSAAFGLTLSQLEYRWQQESLGVNPEGLVARKLFPYLAVAGVMFGMMIVSIVLASRRPKPVDQKSR